MRLALGAERIKNMELDSKSLRDTGAQRTFTDEALQAVAFPLGGIGTGMLSLGGRGNLRDWEIFNEPAKGLDNPFSMFMLWAEPEGMDSFCRVLERDYLPPFMDRANYIGGHGVPQNLLAGLPRYRDAVFKGEYPFAYLELKDDASPVEVNLRAFNPMIPLNDKDSGIPAAIFEWTFKNTSAVPVKLSLGALMANMVYIGKKESDTNGQFNELVRAEGLAGVRMGNADFDECDPRSATMCLATPWKDINVQAVMYEGGWWDRWHLLWDDFSENGEVADIETREQITQEGSVPARRYPETSFMVLHAAINPGEEVTLPVLLSWHAPNRSRRRAIPWASTDPEQDKLLLKNWYATQWEDAWDVAQYLNAHYPRLVEQTEAFHRALFGGNLPKQVLDAASSQMSIFRTTTAMRLADGNFYAFEGCNDDSGCCQMNCTHVWNYEQALAHLYPDLEKSMRDTDFRYNTRPSGSMAFRTILPVKVEQCASSCDCALPANDENIDADEFGLWQFHPAADGQMGCILKTYREWLRTGDTEWLRGIWEDVRRALDYAWKGDDGEGGHAWDPNKDGVMEGEQHNTYDVEFFGPNTMMTSLYLGALRAAEEMARALGEDEQAQEYREIFETGSARSDAELFNGAYYIQNIEVPEGMEVPERLRAPDGLPKYQVGAGCLADQLLGQWFAHVTGLGYLFDPEHVRAAMASIFALNYREELREIANVQRVYGLADEPGLVICAWPERSERPALPFPYSDEVWTGIEYQVAAGLIYEGLIDEGLAVVKAVRERYAGHNRNPWNEVECGHHYARAMASWSLLLALSGYRYSAPDAHIAFAPKLTTERFYCFYSTGSSWGQYRQRTKRGSNGIAKFIGTFNVVYGEQEIRSFEMEWPVEEVPDDLSMVLSTGTSRHNGELLREGRTIRIRLDEPVKVPAGSKFRVTLTVNH